MLRYLHTLSAVLFYLLAGSFFLAYVLLRNALGGFWPLFWLQTADLPLLLSGLLYGGSSVYLSLQPEKNLSKSVALTIGIPLAVIFLLSLVLNFWTA